MMNTSIQLLFQPMGNFEVIFKWNRHYKVPNWKKTLRDIDAPEEKNSADHSYYYEGISNH